MEPWRQDGFVFLKIPFLGCFKGKPMVEECESFSTWWSLFWFVFRKNNTFQGADPYVLWIAASIAVTLECGLHRPSFGSRDLRPQSTPPSFWEGPPA